MLFNKKSRFSVAEKQIKEELLSPDDTPILRINLRFPQITCSKKDPLYKTAGVLYPRVADEFFKYAKSVLYNIALASYSQDAANFAPFAALINWENTYEDNKHLSIMLNISVSDGRNTPNGEIKTQVWQKDNGKKCKLQDFIPKSLLQSLAADFPSLTKKTYSTDNFILRQNGIEVFNADNASVLVPYSRLKVPQ